MSYDGISLVEERRIGAEKSLEGGKVAGLRAAVDGGGFGRSGALILRMRPLHFGLCLSVSKVYRFRGFCEREKNGGDV